MHQLSISQKSRGQFDPLYPSNGGPEEEFNFLHTGIARHFFGTFFFFCILPLYIYLVIRGNETLKQSQGVPPYGTRSYVTSQPDFKRRDYDLIALRVTQSAYFSFSKTTKGPFTNYFMPLMWVGGQQNITYSKFIFVK